MSQKEKENTEDRRTRQFSRIKKDCRQIPFWIPEPIQLKDFDIDRVIDLFNGCQSVEDRVKMALFLKNEHYDQFQKEYVEHREIHDATLLQAKKDWNEGEPTDFIKPRCCYNHYFGLDKKRDGTDYLPIFDYELYLIHNLNIRNFITFVASRGLGKTTTIVKNIPHGEFSGQMNGIIKTYYLQLV